MITYIFKKHKYRLNNLFPKSSVLPQHFFKIRQNLIFFTFERKSSGFSMPTTLRNLQNSDVLEKLFFKN